MKTITLQITTRFLPGHFLYGCPDHTDYVPNCTRGQVKRFQSQVGLPFKYKMLVRVEECPGLDIYFPA